MKPAWLLLLLVACGDDDEAVVVDGAPIDAAPVDAAPVDAPRADAAAIDAPPLAGCPTSYAGCVTYVDRTADDAVAVTIDGDAYIGKCLRIRAGTVVTIEASEEHPLASAPCSAGEVAAAFTPAAPGVYGYFCPNHGGGSGGKGMAGAILVEP